jgi:hypothetical protein
MMPREGKTLHVLPVASGRGRIAKFYLKSLNPKLVFDKEIIKPMQSAVNYEI